VYANVERVQTLSKSLENVLEKNLKNKKEILSLIFGDMCNKGSSIFSSPQSGRTARPPSDPAPSFHSVFLILLLLLVLVQTPQARLAAQ